MPKERVDDAGMPGFRAEVAWRAARRRCDCGASWPAAALGAPAACPECGGPGELLAGHVQVITVNVASPFEFPEVEDGDHWEAATPALGWAVTLEPDGVERLVSALQAAARAAFPC